MTITPVGLTGKQITFSYDGRDASAQVTKSDIQKSEENYSKVETFGGTLEIDGTVTSTVAADLVFDGHVANSVAELLDAALEARSSGILTVEGTNGEYGWTGTAKVTRLDVSIPPDGPGTARTEFRITGPFPFSNVAAV